MDFRQLSYFHAVATEQNITRAAEKLYISQPMLSVAIKKLETELGVPLFERSANSIRLSPAGSRLLKAYGASMAKYEATISHIRETARSEAASLLTIGTEFGVVGSMLGDFTGGSAPVRFLYGDKDKMRQLLSLGAVDMAVSLGRIRLKGFESHVMMRSPFYVALQGDAFRENAAISLQQLKNVPLFCNSMGSTLSLFRHASLAAGVALDITPVDPFVSLFPFLENGLGGMICIPLLLESSSSRMLAGDVHYHAIRELPAPQEICLIRRSGVLPSPEQKAIVEFLTGRFAQNEAALARYASEGGKTV